MGSYKRNNCTDSLIGLYRSGNGKEQGTTIVNHISVTNPKRSVSIEPDDVSNESNFIFY